MNYNIIVKVIETTVYIWLLAVTVTRHMIRLPGQPCVPCSGSVLLTTPEETVDTTHLLILLTVCSGTLGGGFIVGIYIYIYNIYSCIVL